MLKKSTSRSPASGPPAPPEPRRLPVLLRRAWYGLNQAFRRRIAVTGATPDQFTVLRTLSESNPKGLTQRELTHLMSSDPNTIAALLERMETAGWIARKTHERDRRAYRIRLKAAGKAKFAELRDLAHELQTTVLASVPEARRDAFLETLAHVADACRAAADTPPKKAAPEP